MDLAPGAVIGGRYEIVEWIGEGAKGRVAKARATGGRFVALKILREPDSPRFRREADLVRRLAHPNLVALLDVGVHEGRPFLVFELAAGETLEQIVARGPVPAARVRAIALDVLRALGAAHERGVIHRDVKPANIVVDGDGAKLLDFGAARPLDASLASLTGAGEAIGTPRYMSPEQVAAMPVDASTDLYALGLVMAEALTGAAVYDGNLVRVLARHASAEPTPLSPAVLDSALGAVIRRATMKSPAARFRSANAMRAALEPKRRARRPVVLLGAVACGIALGGVAFVARRHDGARLAAPRFAPRDSHGGPLDPAQRTLFDRVLRGCRRHGWYVQVAEPRERDDPGRGQIAASAIGATNVIVTVTFVWSGVVPAGWRRSTTTTFRRVPGAAVEVASFVQTPIEGLADDLLAE